MNKYLKKNQESLNSLLEFWNPIFFTLLLYFGIRIFIAEARYIPSGSMLPGLKIKDRLVIEKLTYKTRDPKRGEIVVFNSPYSFDRKLKPSNEKSHIKCALLSLPLVNLIPGVIAPSCDAYIKRVIAIEGDKISIDHIGNVSINGIKVNEPYVKNLCLSNQFGIDKCPSIYTQVPGGHLLVLGDNRSNSWDSRFWPGGPFLPKDEIIGRAVWRFWPFNRVGIIN